MLGLRSLDEVTEAKTGVRRFLPRVASAVEATKRAVKTAMVESDRILVGGEIWVVTSLLVL